MVEGAYLVISRLRDVAWDATEQLNFDDVEGAPKPFKTVFCLLDKLYQYEDLIEAPSRCDEFFSEFSRTKGDEMQAYLIRHRTLLKRMKEVNVDVPPPFVWLAFVDKSRSSSLDARSDQSNVLR